MSHPSRQPSQALNPILTDMNVRDPNKIDPEGNRILHNLACHKWSDADSEGPRVSPNEDVSRSF